MPILPFPAHSPLAITTISARFGPAGAWAAIQPGIGNFASAGWPAANLALYHPLILPWAYPVKRAFWANGATANGTVDLGIYTMDGALMCSTAQVTGTPTTQAGTSALQFVTVDWLIPPGEYYMGLSLSSGTGTLIRTTGISTAVSRLLGYVQQATAHALPATMTPAAMGQAYTPLAGITKHATF